MWGSWWAAGQWGYACCHQAVKNSYCTGAAGHAAAADSVAQMEANLAARAADSAAAEARSSEAVRKVPLKSPHVVSSSLIVLHQWSLIAAVRW